MRVCVCMCVLLAIVPLKLTTQKTLLFYQTYYTDLLQIYYRFTTAYYSYRLTTHIDCKKMDAQLVVGALKILTLMIILKSIMFQNSNKKTLRNRGRTRILPNAHYFQKFYARAKIIAKYCTELSTSSTWYK